jgi:hypothetical protein
MSAKYTVRDYPLMKVAYGDTIAIAGLTCTVGPCYLALGDVPGAKTKKANSYIGDVLKLKGANRDYIATITTGRVPESGGQDFIEWHPGDWNAAKNLINALYEISLNLGLDVGLPKVEVSRYKNHTIFKVGRRTLTIVGHPLYSIIEKPVKDGIQLDLAVAESE